MNIKQFQHKVKVLSQKLDTTTPERRMMYLMSELGELVNEVIELKSSNADQSSEAILDIKERIGLEIYDVIWNAVDLANILDIDLEEAFQNKKVFNETRKWKRSGYIDQSKE